MIRQISHCAMVACWRVSKWLQTEVIWWLNKKQHSWWPQSRVPRSQSPASYRMTSLWRHLVIHHNVVVITILQSTFQTWPTWKSHGGFIVKSPGESSQTNSHDDFPAELPNDSLKVINETNDVTFWFTAVTVILLTICDVTLTS